ncbi:MAG: c-type cytochrome, partial [Hyphomicrobiaceae bacterium]|nr:c-type cytochrome [Hyphomicrobiaceae bacterium]
MRGARAITAALICAAFPRTAYCAPRTLVQDTSAGKQVYVKWCAGCHGDNGAGDGPAARRMIPAPRDFTGNVTYQIRSTPTGQLPTDGDLLRSIDEGLPGSA